MVNKFTVTHPDGTVSKRTSKSRTYTHAVVTKTPRSVFVAEAQARIDLAERYIAEYREAIATGDLTFERKPWVSFGKPGNHEYVTAFLGGRYVTAWVEVDGVAKSFDKPVTTVEAAREHFEGRIADLEADLPARREFLAAQEARPEFVYDVIRWSSREDLAVKAAQGEFNMPDRWTLTVVPVD